MQVGPNRIALSIVAALFSTSSFALVGGSIDNNTTDSPWASVGSITFGGSVFTGVLLDSQHVLTAAHVVAGQVATPGNVSFNLNVGGDLTQTLGAASISVYDGYTGTATNTTTNPDWVWHDDLAVITLSTPITGVVPIYDLYGGSMLNQTISMVSYGGNGASVKKVGQNVVDEIRYDEDNGKNPNSSFNSTQEVFVFDLDGAPPSTGPYGGEALANEAGYAGGDSGSPVFVNVGGQWQIAGIGTFTGTTTTGSGGTIGGGTIVSSYIPWIEMQMAAPVPEPQAWGMMLAGLGLVGAAVRAKARS
jgi:hypothetical protein